MTMKKKLHRYPPELREKAVGMVLDNQHTYGSQWEAMLGCAEARPEARDSASLGPSSRGRHRPARWGVDRREGTDRRLGTREP